jgi:hypothetical protein
VIQEKDIMTCENGEVIFRYRNGKTREVEYRTVSGAKFLCMIVQHVLRKEFRRARNYSLLLPNSKRLIQLIQYLINLYFIRNQTSTTVRRKWVCSCCGAAMRIIRPRIYPQLGYRIKAGLASPVM